MADWKQYRAGEFSVDAADRTVRRGDESSVLTPKELQLFELLAERPGEIVEKERILATLWPDAHVSESNLTQQVYRLRSIFGNDAIQTIPKRGYRLTLAVTHNEALAPPPPTRPSRTIGWRPVYTWVTLATLAVAAFVTVGAARFRPGPDAEAYDLFLRGQSHLEAADRLEAGVSRNGERSMAVDLLNKAIARDPRFADAHGLLGRALCESSQRGQRTERFLERAEESASRALGLDPDNLHAWTARICLAHARGRPGDALRVAQRIQGMKAESAAAHYAAGEAFLRAGLVRPAAGELEKAVRGAPRTIRFREQLAFAWMLSGDPARCLQVLSPILKSEQGGFWHATNCLKQLGRWEDAIEMGRKNLESQREPNPVAFRALAIAYRGAGREREARELLERGIRHFEGLYEAEPSSRHAIFLSLLCAHLERRDDTARWVRLTLEREPKNSLWLVLSGVAFATLGDDDRALAQFERAYDAGLLSRPLLEWQVQPHMGSRTIRQRREFQSLLDRLDQRTATLAGSKPNRLD